MFSVILFDLILLIWGAASARHAPAEPLVVEVPGGNRQGEVALCDAQGRILRRFIGLGTPGHLFPTADGHLLVTDRLGGRLIQLDFNGVGFSSWIRPPAALKPYSALPLPGGHILIAAGYLGVGEIEPSGHVVWKAPSPVPGGFVLSAVRLPDGSTFVTMRRHAKTPQQTLFWIPAQAQKATWIAQPFENSKAQQPRISPWKPDGSEFLLWDRIWARVYRCTYTDGELEVLGTIPLSRVDSAMPDSTGGVVFTRQEHQSELVGQWRPDGRLTKVQVTFHPLAATLGPRPETYFHSYVRLEDKSWPAARWPPGTVARINWTRFWWWIIAAVAFAFILHLLAWFAPGSPREQGNSAANAPPTTPPANGPREVGAGWRVLAFLLIGAGLALAGLGHFYLRKGFIPPWFFLYAIGAVLAAIVLETWRRRVLRDTDQFGPAFQSTGPKVACRPSFILGCVVVMAGGVVLFCFRKDPFRYTDQVALWVALLLILASMSILVPTPPWRWRIRINPRLLIFPAIPLLLGMFTLGYKLSEVPYNLHFDQVFYALDALHLLEGRHKDIWALIYDVPLMGRLPEIVGLTLVDPSRVGFSLGSVLYGLTGILAVYLLGQCYRDRWTGMLAAIFLAGSVPFIHLTRTNFQGNAITGALWAVTLFALALRSGRPGTWILAGLAAGFCFHEWAAARIAPLAIFVCGLALALRSPRATLRQWYGPLLMGIAVLVCLVPFFPLWLSDTRFAFPRTGTLLIYRPDVGIDWSFLKESFGKPLWNCLGWLYEEGYRCPHGTLTPAANSVEAVLFSVGAIILLTEGFSLNVLLVGYTLLILLMGAWTRPPQYARLALMAPMVAILIARVLTGMAQLVPVRPRWPRPLGLALLAIAAILISPVANMRAYLDHETGRRKDRPAYEACAVGFRLREMGPAYHYYLIITGRPSWSIPNGSGFAQMLPYVWNLHVTEIHDLPTRLPLPSDEPTAVVVQGGRADKDIPQLLDCYPEAKVEDIVDVWGHRLARLVVIDDPKPAGIIHE